MQNDLLFIQNTSTDSTEYEEKFVNLTANKVVFVDTNSLPTTTGIGLSTQFLKADGSLDSTTYEPILPETPVNPDNKYLNGNRLWSEISIGAGGYAGNVYASNVDSDVPGYKTMSYALDSTESVRSIVVNNNTVLSETCLYDSGVGVTVIPSGLWKATFYAKVNSTIGDTTLKIQVFTRHLVDGSETDLFEITSPTIENTADYAILRFEGSQIAFTVLETDRVGIRIKGSTTRTQNTTINYIVGDGRGLYITTPLQIRHSQLRDLNGDTNYLHVTSTEKSTWNNSVPYIGATTDLNMGNFGVTAGKNFKVERTLIDLNYHAYDDLTSINITNNQGVLGYSSYDAYPSVSGSTINHIHGYQSRITNNASNLINSYGYSYQFQNNGHVEFLVGLSLAAPIGAGTIADKRAIFIGDYTGGYSIYSNGGDNYFKGVLRTDSNINCGDTINIAYNNAGHPYLHKNNSSYGLVLNTTYPGYSTSVFSIRSGSESDLFTFDGFGGLTFASAKLTGLVGTGTRLTTVSSTGAISATGINVGKSNNVTNLASLSFSTALGKKISFYGGLDYMIGVQGGVLQIGTNSSSDRVALGYGATGSFTEVLKAAESGVQITRPLSVSGQITSTLSTGTPPLVVASSTLNTNLNADLLDGQHGNYYQTASSKIKLTPEGGYAILLTNKTGASSVKGTLVYADPDIDNAFEVNPINGDMPFGVVYESGIADGSECWVVVAGIAEVLLVNTVASTRSYIAYSSGSVAGRIDTAATVPAATTHFREIGHTVESKTGGTDVLCKCVLHFN